jgi:hypothetical protein
VVDSSSVKASPVAGPRGFDGAKKIDGVKRHVPVDSGGILVAAVLTPANVQDRAAFPKLLCKAKRTAASIARVWVDKGYTGRTVADAAGSSNAPTDGSTTAAASTATTKSPSTRTKACSSSA